MTSAQEDSGIPISRNSRRRRRRRMRQKQGKD